jgi:hypothetical protein
MKSPEHIDVVGTELLSVSEFVDMMKRIGDRIQQGESFTEASIPEIVRGISAPAQA